MRLCVIEAGMIKDILAVIKWAGKRALASGFSHFPECLKQVNLFTDGKNRFACDGDIRMFKSGNRSIVLDL